MPATIRSPKPEAEAIRNRVIEGTDDGKQTWKQLKAMNQLGVTCVTLNLLR